MPSHSQRVAASLARPAIDLRHLLPPVRAQGPRPLCVPFSVTATHEAARSLAGSAVTSDILAVEPLWQYCVNAGNADHLGTSLRATADALNSAGQPLEAHWPYNDTLGAGTEPAPATAANVAWYAAAMVELPLAHDGVEDLIEIALSAGFPVVVLIEITAEFESPREGGEIALPLITSPLGDYHAVVAVGAATSADGANRRLLVGNTWGPAWGAGGYGWLPLEHLTAFAVEAAVIDPRAMLTI